MTDCTRQSAIKTHYSAAELAEMRLPGLPATRENMLRFADRNGWPCIEIPSRGRGGIRREYAPPAEIMEAIRAKAAQTLVSTVSSSTALVTESGSMNQIETAEQALKADARRGVLQALERMMAQTGYPLKKCATLLITMARTGQASDQMMKMLRLARDERGRSSPDGLPSDRSLTRFVEYGRTGQLAPKVRQRDMTVPEWAPEFLAYYQLPSKPTIARAYDQFVKDLGHGNVPSIHQVRRWLDKVGNVTREIGRMGPRELKALKPFIRRGFEDLLPAEIYSADGHTFDAEVQHPLHGRPFRPEITTVVDIATRKTVGWSAGLAESALAVLDALRHAVETHGIPAILYVDNGSGYKNQMMHDCATGLMSRIGTEMIHSLPYNSQARGVIERLQQTIWVNAARTLPGYMGRDMDREAKLNVFKLSRKAVKTGNVETMPLIGWPGFLEFCQSQIDDYNARPHRSLPKITCPSTGRRRHMTPDEAWALSVERGFEAHTVTDLESRPLFRPQVLRTVHRAELEVFGNRYFARDLEEFHGDQLRVGYDVHDANHVWVYDDTGRFICKAEWNGNKTQYMPQTVIERGREKRAQGRLNRLEAHADEVRAELRGDTPIEQPTSVNIPGFLTVNVADLAARAANAETVMAFLPPEPIPAPIPQPVPETPEWSPPETPDARWAEWQSLSAIPEESLAGERQKKWRQTYQSTAEFRVFSRKQVFG